MRKQQPHKHNVRTHKVVTTGIAYNATAFGLYGLKTLASIIRKPLSLLSDGFRIGEKSVRSVVDTAGNIDKMAR